ncbi:MAG: hypothetical protein IPP55_06490 [Anaerolineales bacterium]|nr:hypothetical protein [Anaerolineales bacterium]
MNEELQEPQPPTLPLSTVQKFLYGFIVIAAPIFNFSLIELMKPEWQDGRFTSYLYLFLLPEASWVFFPLLLYAVLSYLLLLWDSEQFADSIIIRLGIYGGTFLALQYSILSFITTFSPSPVVLAVLLAYSAPLILPKLYSWLRPQWDKLFEKYRLAMIIIPLIILALVLWGFFFVLAIFGIASPFWSFLIAFQASRWLWKHYETKFSFAKGFGIFAWISAYAFALRFNILKMFELYNALPTEPPNCYIATAAANGHPRFVGSREVTLANGKSMRVNRQLQRLKAAEIALMGVSGTGHRMMRKIYDVVGKQLAAHIHNPFLADVSYLLLKPFELLAVFTMKFLLSDIEGLIANIYIQNHSKGQPWNT